MSSHLTTTRRSLSARLLLIACALSFAVVGGAPARAANRPGCSNDLKHRTAEETIRQHLALLQSGQLDAAMCDYAESAMVVLPNQIVTGLDQIRGGLAAVGSFLGGAIPQIQTLTATSDVVLITFTAFGTPCTIPDGSDTYIVEKGQIITQTVHDTFHSAPGATCPVAAPGN
jgi:ketosteroid isomerase-like protein